MKTVKHFQIDTYTDLTDDQMNSLQAIALKEVITEDWIGAYDDNRPAVHTWIFTTVDDEEIFMIIGECELTLINEANQDA